MNRKTLAMFLVFFVLFFVAACDTKPENLETTDIPAEADAGKPPAKVADTGPGLAPPKLPDAGEPKAKAPAK